MPWYDYKCPDCGYELFDVKRKITENVAEEECPICFGSMKQIFNDNHAGFDLKGGGWAKDKYIKPTKTAG
jgi:putative FmdB family regulatory protein